MGEKSKGQRGYAVDRINPQTTPQIPTGVTSHPRHNVGSREKERRAPARQVGLFVFWPSGLLGTSWCGCRVTSDSTLLKNEKLPNEPISDFGLRSLHQELMPIHTPREPGKRTHFSRVTPEPPPGGPVSPDTEEGGSASEIVPSVVLQTWQNRSFSGLFEPKAHRREGNTNRIKMAVSKYQLPSPGSLIVCWAFPAPPEKGNGLKFLRSCEGRGP